ISTPALPGNVLLIQTDSYNVVASSFNAAGKDVEISTFLSNGSIGIAGGAGTLNISTTEFNQFVANSLEFGLNQGGDITLGSSLNLTGRFAILFEPGTNFIGAGNNIISDRDVSINAINNLSIGNIITAGTSNITLHAGFLGGPGGMSTG